MNDIVALNVLQHGCASTPRRQRNAARRLGIQIPEKHDGAGRGPSGPELLLEVNAIAVIR